MAPSELSKKIKEIQLHYPGMI